MSHEEAFVRAFILPEKQARYLEKLTCPKRHSLFLDRLNHALDYDPAFVTRIPASKQTPPKIEALLRNRGAAEICHVISSSAAWDRRDLSLREALDLVVGYGTGTILCCVSGRLAYYEGEDMGDRMILAR